MTIQTLHRSLSSLRPKTFLLLFLAGVINAIGVTLFLAPVQLYDSGISGTAMLFWQLTPEPYTLPMFLVLLNTPLFLFGMKKQGLTFTVYSLWAVLIYALASLAINTFFPTSGASPFAGDDLLLCAVFGGLISGVGSGMTIRFGGAIDGVEVMAVIFSKRLGMTVGSFVMVYNVLLYVAIGCIFRSWIMPLYSILTYCAAIKSVDFIVEGLDKPKSATIITSRADAVSEALSEAFGRGITQIPAKGYYSGKEQTLVYFVVNRFQIAKMKAIIQEVDPDAFVSISEVSDMLGSSVKK